MLCRLCQRNLAPSEFSKNKLKKFIKAQGKGKKGPVMGPVLGAVTIPVKIPRSVPAEPSVVSRPTTVALGGSEGFGVNDKQLFINNVPPNTLVCLVRWLIFSCHSESVALTHRSTKAWPA